MQTLNGINSLLGICQGNKHKAYGKIRIKNEPLLDYYTLANEFYTYFSSIAKNLDKFPKDHI